MKKIISLVLSICVLVSVMPMAFAAETAETSWIQTFDGYDGTTVPEGFSMGADQNGITMYGTSGVFGKAKDDVSYTHEVHSDGTDSNLGYSEYPQWNMNTSLGNINFEEGDIFVWGYEMALDSYYGTKDIRFDVQNQDNTRKSLNFLSMANNQNGKITCMGQTVTNSIPLNTWVSLDFVLRTSTNILDVYYNGVKTNTIDLTTNIGKSTLRINFYRMFMVAAKVNGAYVSTHNYIDNFYAKIVKEEPVILPVKVTSDNSKITVFEDLKQISADEALSVEEFLAGLNLPEGSEVVLEDADKNEQSGSLGAGYLRIKSEDERYAYYAVSTYSPAKLTYNNFDSLADKKIENNQTVEGITVYTPLAVGAEGVVEDSDNVLKIYPSTSARKLNMTVADTGDTFAIAFDIKTDKKEGGNAGLTLKYENASGSTSNFNDIVMFSEDGAIRFSSNTTIGSYEANQWYHVTVFADKESKKARVYIDGELAIETTWSPLNSFTRIVDAILCNNAAKDADKNVYFDNLCIMPISSIDAVDTEPMNISVEITNEKISDKNIISGYGEMTVAEFKDILSIPENASVKAYLNGEECDNTAILEEGMLVKVTAEDLRHKKVYYIKEAIRKNLAITVDGKQVNQLYAGMASGVLTGYVQTPVSAVLEIVETKDGNVVQSKSAPVTLSGDFDEEVTLDKAVADEAGTKITVSLYDNEEDKNLLMPQKEIAYSETLEYSTEIMGVYGGRDAIYTITMDDGYAKSMNNYFKPWFEKYDLRGSSLSICTWMTPEFLENTQQMVLDGRLDIMSHSYTHPATVDDLVANAYNEVYGSKAYLRELFPGADVLSYGPGSGVMNDSVFAEVKKAYYANRAGTRGYNDLDISGDAWYDIKVQGVLGGSGTTWKSSANSYDGETAQSMNKWLDNAVSNKKWLVEMWHSVCWPETEGSTNYVSDGGYRPIPVDISEQHLAYASQLQSEGKLWVAKFDDALKYLYERNNAVLTDVATRTSRNISLTAELDKAIFNHPLTLKSQVPATWNYVKITQGDIVTYKQVQNDENGSYVIYDALVNYEDISLEETDELSENEAAEGFKISVPENLNQNVLEGEKFETVEFSVEGDCDLNSTVWYVDGVASGVGASFTFTPAADGEVVISARNGLKITQNRRVKTTTTIPPKGVQITNLKYKGASVTTAENTQTFDANNALKFMWGDMTNENMSFQHGWVERIKNIPEALNDAKFMTTGVDFNVDASGNYLEFTVDRDVIIVGMYQGDAPRTNLVADGWTICSENQNSEIFNKYKYMRGDKTTYFSYMFYKEFDKGSVTIPYAGAYGWAHGGGFAIVENIKEYTLEVSTNGDSVMASINGAEASDWGNTKTESFKMGEDITLTVVCEDENKSFIFWKNENGIILSENEEYSFKTGSGAKLVAVYADKSLGSFVMFKNAGNRVLASGQISAEIKVPENPYIAGYEFAGWYLDGEKQNLSAGDTVSGYETDTVFSAGYIADDEKYSVNLINANEESGEFLYNAKLTVTAIEKDGETFAYWTKDGAIVSYDTEYTFYVSSDTEIEAVYSENTEKANVLVMSVPVVIAGDKIGFYAERHITEEFSIIESGILVSSKAGVSLDSYDYKATAKNTANDGQFTVRKAGVSSGETWYAAAYVIYTDGSGVYTIYSNEVSKGI